MIQFEKKPTQFNGTTTRERSEGGAPLQITFSGSEMNSNLQSVQIMIQASQTTEERTQEQLNAQTPRQPLAIFSLDIAHDADFDEMMTLVNETIAQLKSQI